MAMTVDTAGQHQFAGGINLPRRGSRHLPQRRDFSVPDADVTQRAVDGGCHRPVADDQVEGLHSGLSRRQM
jgi:hypothetical protein